MMTTLAAMLGAVPLMLAIGTGSELRQPLGIAIFGGLLISQMLTLFTTPVICLTLERVLYNRQTEPNVYPTVETHPAGQYEPSGCTSH